MKHSLFPFKTGFQCVLESREQLPELKQLLDLLHQEGFCGVELNLPDLEFMKPEELKELLEEHQMQMNMLATGVYAKTHGLSLSAGDPKERKRAVDGCRKNIDYAASMGCGIIIGFLKGGPDSDREYAEQLFLESMLELKPYIEKKQVQVLIEATNHKEASIIRTLEEGAQIIDRLDSPLIRLLADTYHMNIEEPSLLDSLSDYMDYYPHLHISDDNRAYPGLGSLDFAPIYWKLMERGYKGTLAVEGNIQKGLLDDTQACAAYLHETCGRLGENLIL
ncbi:MAG: sugar phosphate isomerase/epimerase [Lachnospiraceae bacterium]|nr:sugar phosphate isomerase/epimerase [Lachnospiraceae bacterium]